MEPSSTNLSTPEGLEITSEDIDQMVQELFDTMLGMPATRAEPQNADVFAGGLRGKIEINGVWSAKLDVVATMKLCADVCCNMFGTDSNSLDAEDVADALGEVTNVVGGNVKGIIDQDCNLTIPEVVKFDAEEFSEDANYYWFECNGEYFCLKLIVE